MPASAQRILVLRGGAIGDFILTLPVFAALRRHFPDASLALLGYPRIAQLAQAAGLVDQVLPLEAPDLAGFFAVNGSLASRWCDFFASCMVVVSYLSDPEQIFERNLARCSPARFIRGPHRPDKSVKLHATSVLLEPLETLGITNADPIPRLPLPDPPRRTLPPGRWWAMHPGSGSTLKNWPESHWQQLLSHLAQSTEIHFLLVGGEAEGDRLPRLAGSLPAGRIKLAQDLPLVDLALMLQQCQAFIGHDSGISHLAAALAVPTLVLWGPTETAIWRPLGKTVHLLHAGKNLADLSPTRVIKELAGCFPNITPPLAYGRSNAQCAGPGSP